MNLRCPAFNIKTGPEIYNSGPVLMETNRVKKERGIQILSIFK
jgi:hypothetical protein